VGLLSQKKLLEYYDSLAFYPLEVQDDVSLTILNDVLIERNVIFLKAELKSYLPMNEKDVTKGFFSFLKSSN